MNNPTPIPRMSLLRTFKAVAWSFFGAQLNPFHVIAVGLVCCLAFVVGLIVLVHWVVGH
jgi:Protein of unknown function (DUF2970)